MRDRFVSGIHDKNLQQRLPAEGGITFDCAFNIAIATESAVNQQGQLQSSSEHGQVHKAIKHTGKSPTTSRQKPKKCYRCLGSHHAKDCRFRNFVCDKCNKKGHIARACTKRQRKAVKSNHNLLESNSDSNSEDTTHSTDLYNANHVKSQSGSRPVSKFTVTLRVEARDSTLKLIQVRHVPLSAKRHIRKHGPATLLLCQETAHVFVREQEKA